VPDVLRLALIVLGGLAVGGSLGLLGGGGTILTLPLLLLLGVEPKPAIAMSLMVVAATAAVAAVAHARASNVDWRGVALFAPTTALGGYAGGRAAEFFQGDLLLLIFTGLMVAAGAATLRPAPARSRADTRPHALALALPGAVVGSITGLVGAGGGFLFVPAFVLVGGLSMRRAVGTSLVVISINSLAALAGQLGHVAIRGETAGAVTAAAATGAWVGARLVRRTPEAWLRRAFGIFILLIAAWMLARSPYVHALLGGHASGAGGAAR
jgi:uncharacterized membrane protein YfcA